MSGYRVVVTIILISLLSCLTACKQPASVEYAGTAEFPLTVEDSLKRTVTIEKAPQRIVSLAPSNTEIVFSLRLEDRLVGVTNCCDYPPEANCRGLFCTERGKSAGKTA